VIGNCRNVLFYKNIHFRLNSMKHQCFLVAFSLMAHHFVHRLRHRREGESGDPSDVSAFPPFSLYIGGVVKAPLTCAYFSKPKP
jgi:hypothetical protein